MTEAKTTAIEAIAGTGAHSVKNPPSVPLLLPPLMAAGIDLAKFVLWMIVGAGALLIMMAMVAESSERDASNNASELMLALPSAGVSPAVDKRLSGVVTMLRRSAANPALALSPVETQNARLLIDEALKIASITAEQKSNLDGKCIPLPTPGTKDRAAVLERCAVTLETVLVPSAGDAQNLPLIKELQKAQAEERIARRAFWMQIAQLVLINLLLPILTALLGYIFGTRQAS